MYISICKYILNDIKMTMKKSLCEINLWYVSRMILVAIIKPQTKAYEETSGKVFFGYRRLHVPSAHRM